MYSFENMTTFNETDIALSCHSPLVTHGQEVRRGERIAVSLRSGRGDLHSPFAGKVTHVGKFRIRITDEGGEDVTPKDLSDLKGAELYRELCEMGADLPVADEVKVLIINGADPEPDIHSRENLLVSSPASLERGLDTLAVLYAPKRTVLAVTRGAGGSLPDIETVEVSEQYPSALDPLVALAVTGVEMPENTAVVGLDTLYQVGRIMETGFPAMETMVTLASGSRFVPVGTPVGRLLADEEITIENRDRVVLGGILTGTAAASPAQGITRDTNAVRVVANPAPVARDTPCVGCGECVRRCPARLDPSMITSCAEFGHYDKAEALSVESCFECGLCGFFCLAHRPMLQYIRLAKSEIARARTAFNEEDQQ